MYYSHSTSQPENTMNQGMPSSDTYYSHSTVLPMIPSTAASDITPSQPPTSHSILSHPPLSTSRQVYDHHHQELVSQDTSLCPVLSSAIDEDGSSHASSSLSGNRTGGQDTYILQCQKQLEESQHLQTQYYYRIEQLMALVEKQTMRISELQEQLANQSDTSVNHLVNSSHQQQAHPSSSYHHPIQHQHQLRQQPPRQH